MSRLFPGCFWLAVLPVVDLTSIAESYYALQEWELCIVAVIYVQRWKP